MSLLVPLFVVEGLAIAAVVWGVALLIWGRDDQPLPPPTPRRTSPARATTGIPDRKPAPVAQSAGGSVNAEKNRATASVADNAQVSLTKAADRA